MCSNYSISRINNYQIQVYFIRVKKNKVKTHDTREKNNMFYSKMLPLVNANEDTIRYNNYT